ncbi:aminopeptidase [Pterulicium gracile]|uniref:Peptide hydrolase n=1 Tax=Pterulicium gracile TaxID=1884261 RepID=A0A5C3QR62_9AGAR|nr:aminopeptidase [Pterula gracilis]
MKLSIGFVLAGLLAFVHAAPLTHSEIQQKASQGLRLLSLAEAEEPVWRTEDQRLQLIRAGTTFIDVTETYELEKEIAAKGDSFTSSSLMPSYPAPSRQAQVTPLLARLSTSKMTGYLSSLTAYNNRYYTSSTGSAASVYIQNTIRSIASAAGRSDITVSAFSHSWAQTSTIVKFASTSTGPITVLGGHMDSINSASGSPSSARAPGADDDGTGTVNLMNIIEVLATSGFKPSTPLEFHFYAAEEVGLLGSNAIAVNYKNAGKQIKAFMQLDMTGYFRPGSTEVIALQADYIDSGLNTFVRQLASSYSRLPVTMDVPCNYACSDHASWYRQGYPTTFPFEAVTGNDDPSIHTSGDTTSVSGFSWSHSLEFAKVGLGFAVELSA